MNKFVCKGSKTLAQLVIAKLIKALYMKSLAQQSCPMTYMANNNTSEAQDETPKAINF